MYQKRSYVIAFENADNVDGMYIDEAENGMSFRNYEDLLLIGGGGHRTGKQGGNWRAVKEFSEKMCIRDRLKSYERYVCFNGNRKYRQLSAKGG